MGHLIEAMLELAQVSRARFNQCPVNLTALAEEVLAELQKGEPHRQVKVKIASNMSAPGAAAAADRFGEPSRQRLEVYRQDPGAADRVRRRRPTSPTPFFLSATTGPGSRWPT